MAFTTTASASGGRLSARQPSSRAARCWDGSRCHSPESRSDRQSRSDRPAYRQPCWPQQLPHRVSSWQSPALCRAASNHRGTQSSPADYAGAPSSAASDNPA